MKMRLVPAIGWWEGLTLLHIQMMPLSSQIDYSILSSHQL